MLLDVASDDLMEGDQIRRCIRDIREVRMSKMRQLMEGVDATAVGGGDGLVLSGVGAMEVGEARGFISGAAETLRYDLPRLTTVWDVWSNFYPGKLVLQKKKPYENRLKKGMTGWGIEEQGTTMTIWNYDRHRLA